MIAEAPQVTAGGADAAAMTPADGRMMRRLAGALRPRKRERPSAWIEKNVTLTSKMGVQVAGRMRMGYFPWLADLADALYDHPEKKGVVAMKQTQRGFTLTVLAKMACDLATERGNMLYVIGRQEDAEMIAQERFRPMVEDCPVTRERLETARDEDPNIPDRVDVIGYDAGSIYFTTAKSASGLSTKTCPRAYVDEFDQAERAFPAAYGSLLPFVKGRQYAVYYGAELWMFSHPTLWTCGIGKVFREQSDQGRWVFDCPNNGCTVALDHRCVHFKEVDAEGRPEPKSAVLRCPCCGEEISDEQRWRAVWPGPDRPGGRAGGSGRRESPLPDEDAAAAPYLGFMVNGLCDPYRPLLEFATALALAQAPKDLQAVLNTLFGEPYEETHQGLTAADLDDAMKTAGGDGGDAVTMPGGANGVKVVALGVDVQMPRDAHTLYTTTMGFTAGGDVFASFKLVRGFGAMLALTRTMLVNLSNAGEGMPRCLSPKALGIDDNWEGGAVRDTCRELVYAATGGARVDLVPLRFASRSGGALSRDTPWQLRAEAKRTNPALPHLGAIEMFDLYRHHWVQRVLDLIAHKKLHVVGDVPADLKAHLTSQVLTAKRASHNWQHEHEVMEWDLAKGRRDDWLMALAYGLAVASILCGVDRLHVTQAGPVRAFGNIRWG